MELRGGESFGIILSGGKHKRQAQSREAMSNMGFIDLNNYSMEIDAGFHIFIPQHIALSQDDREIQMPLNINGFGSRRLLWFWRRLRTANAK
mgnify:CR=1 FL=1